jgi:H+-transporting ATPase
MSPSSDEFKTSAVSLGQVFTELSTTSDGLTTPEAEKRLQEYGFNEIVEKKQHPWLKFFGFFWGPIPWMIEIAAVLAALIHHWETFYIIVAMLLLNAGVGFWQRQKADHAIALLKEKMALTARVRRDCAWGQIPARELVPGDIVRLRLGDIAPADLRLIDGDYLLVDESALTGESLPQEKTVGQVAYAGAIVRQGEMDGVAAATGLNTYFGKTARLVETARTASHLQKALVKMADYLILVGLLLVVVVFLVALFRHENLWETLEFALVLTVAAVPATLPAVLSVTMAIGAGLLAHKGAIVSNMAAIDELAGMDILCSDKTGTITQNLLSVKEIRPLSGFTPQDVSTLAGLASREEDGDPIDLAVLDAAKPENLTGFEIIAFKPFDPVSKRVEVALTDTAGQTFQVSKGAPQAILALLAPDITLAAEVDAVVQEFAAKGYRTLGVARTDATGLWRYAGLISLYDPPRDDSAATIQSAQSLGVAIKMVTGDHLAIARETARQVNLGTDIKTPEDFLDRPDREAKLQVEAADGFAQVFPEHKFHIVELLQTGGHIVGMTGDGVNDAPALKKADAGIAVAGATDAAKSAAAIVLTRPGLSVIIDAIQESRRIFQRMKSYAIYRIGGIMRVLLFVTLSILIFNLYPVTAVMIVLQTLLNDLPILAIAYDHARPGDLPDTWEIREILSISTFLGVMGVFFSFSLLYLGLRVLHLNLGQIQTFIFLKLAVAGYLDIFMGRTRGFFWSLKPGGLLVISGILTRLLATAMAVFGWFMTPIAWQIALLVWGWSVLELLVTDPLKVCVYRVLDHRGIVFHR